MPPPLCLDPFYPGMRLAVAVSGGADSVALLRALAPPETGKRYPNNPQTGDHAAARGGEAAGGGAAAHGLILSVVHMHHGIRGADADADAAFVADLARSLGLRFLCRDVDTPSLAWQAARGLEEMARTLRYGWFAELLVASEFDAIATAHTLNDQAETVLHKLLRGAWTEGLSGIHPVVRTGGAPGSQPSTSAQGPASSISKSIIVRPFLEATHEQIVAWLQTLGQPWREDATNADLSYTRNRIRHQLLPELATYNPQIATQLAQTATLARDDEAWWQSEVDRLLPGLLLPGRAVRGGGRASSTLPGERSLAIEVERLRGFHPALLRRLLRAAARELGVSLDYQETARLLRLVEARGTANPRRDELTGELRAERTPRELRLVFTARSAGAGGSSTAGSEVKKAAEVEIPIPGEGQALGWRVRASLADVRDSPEPAILRAALPGDRVQLRYSRGAPKKIKEVLERMGIAAADRAGWPVLAWRGEIVWMRGAVLEPTPISELLMIEAVEVVGDSEATSL